MATTKEKTTKVRHEQITLVLPKGIQGDNIYGNGTTAQFAFCSAPSESKNTITMRSSFHSCRDSFLEILNKRIKIKYNMYSGEDYPVNANSPRWDQIPLRNIRLLFGPIYNTGYSADILAAKNDFRKRLDVAINILNILEEKHGWKLTQVYDIDSSAIKRGNLHMIVGDKNWIRSTHYASLFILILRLCYNASCFNNLKDHDDLMKKLVNYAKESHVDSSYASKTLSWWNPLMADIEEVFKDLPQEEVYSNKVLVCHYGEGIWKLCTGSSAHKIIQKRVRDLSNKKWKLTIPAKPGEE